MRAPRPDEVAGLTAKTLTNYRAQLSHAAIPDTVPIRISESGWPTGLGRSEQLQADLLRAVVGTVAKLHKQVGIAHLERFALRDADSASGDVFGHLGLLRDDYSPEPAYQAFRELIAEFGTTR